MSIKEKQLANIDIVVPITGIIEQLKQMSIERNDLAEMVAQMRDEVTETRISMKKITQTLEGKPLSGTAEFPSGNDPTRTAGGRKIHFLTIHTLFLPELLAQLPEIISFNFAGHGPLSQCSKGSESVSIIEGATGKECVHFYIKMMKEHKGDPPKNIFDTDPSKTRKEKGKVKKMIDTFSSVATKRERASLMSEDIPLET